MSEHKRKKHYEGFGTYITESEAMQIFEEFVKIKYDATKGFSKANKANTYNFYSGKHRNQAYIKMNPCASGLSEYVNPVMCAWISGISHNTNITAALKEVNSTWKELSQERYANHMRELDGLEANKIKTIVRELTPEEKEAIEEKRLKKEAAELYESAKSAYLQRLPGAAMAQYIYLASKAQQGTEYHQGQIVKTPNQHRYPKKKQIEINPTVDDFYIITPVVPTVSKVLTFLGTDKFQMPENPYGFTKQDIVNRINDPSTQFRPEDYVTRYDQTNGNGIIPSRDPNGVVTNLQKFLVEDYGKSDKMFMKNGVTERTNFIFDFQKKLIDSNYEPKVIAITEGWATGRSLNKAVNEKSDDTLVVVSWTANKLEETIKNYAEKYPKAEIVLFADNDVKSFKFMNEHEDYNLVRNTGVLEAIKIGFNNPELSDRLRIAIPEVDYKNPAFDGKISDYNDIELTYGFEACKQAIQKAIDDACDRKERGEPEIAHAVKLFNEQATHYSDIHNIPIKLVNEKAEWGCELYKPNSGNTPAPNKSAEVKAEAQTAPVTPEKSFNSFKGFFDVPVNDAAKTSVEKKLEEALRFTHGGVNHQPAENNIPAISAVADNSAVAPKEPVQHTPEPQPIADPAIITGLVYSEYIRSIYMESTFRVNDVDEMMDRAKNPPNQNKLLGAILDPVMHPHIMKEIESSIEKTQHEQIAESLSAIKNIVSDDFLQYTAETHEMIKQSQRSIASEFISSRYDVGVNDEVSNAILGSDILQQDTEAKRDFYRDIRDSLRNLDVMDSKWLHHTQEILESSVDIANQFYEPKQEVSPPSKENTSQPSIDI